MAEIPHFRINGVDHGKVTFTRDKPFSLKTGTWFAVIDGTRQPSGSAVWTFTLSDEGTGPTITSTMSPALTVGGVSYTSLSQTSRVTVSGGHISQGSGTLHGPGKRPIVDATWDASDTEPDGDAHHHKSGKS
jgi:hypothetical protein